MYKTTTAQKHALGAYIKLWRASRAVEVYVHQHLANHQLTLSQFVVLEVISSLGPLSQKELAVKVLMSTSNLSTVISNLERDGLVVRERNTNDRRLLKIHLTEQGQQLIDGIMPIHIQGVEQAFEALETKEIKQLSRICRKLGLSLDQAPSPTMISKKRRQR